MFLVSYSKHVSTSVGANIIVLYYVSMLYSVV